MTLQKICTTGSNVGGNMSKMSLDMSVSDPQQSDAPNADAMPMIFESGEN